MGYSRCCRHYYYLNLCSGFDLCHVYFSGAASNFLSNQIIFHMYCISCFHGRICFSNLALSMVFVNLKSGCQMISILAMVAVICISEFMFGC